MSFTNRMPFKSLKQTCGIGTILLYVGSVISLSSYLKYRSILFPFYSHSIDVERELHKMVLESLLLLTCPDL